jgi:predicted lysophospholipase L1 biosynthesis ABC-type transport system permease subunit
MASHLSNGFMLEELERPANQEPGLGSSAACFMGLSWVTWQDQRMCSALGVINMVAFVVVVVLVLVWAYWKSWTAMRTFKAEW